MGAPELLTTVDREVDSALPPRPFSRRNQAWTAIAIALLLVVAYVGRRYLDVSYVRYAIAGVLGALLILSGPMVSMIVYFLTTFFHEIPLPGIPVSLNQVIGVEALFSWGLWMLMGRCRWPRSGYGLFLVAALAYYLTSALTGLDFEGGLDYAVHLLAYALLGVVVYSCLTRPALWHLWIWAILGVSAFMASFGLLEYIIGIDISPQARFGVKGGRPGRIDGFAMNSIMFAFNNLWAVAFGIYLSLESRSHWRRLLAMGCTAVLVFSALLTFNRQTPLILGMMMLVAALLFRHPWMRLLLASVVLAALVSSPFAAAKIVERFSMTQNTRRDVSFASRHDTALITGQILLKHPLMGVGLGSYSYVWRDYAGEGLLVAQYTKGRKRYPDLGIAQMLAESGLIGFTLELCIMLGGVAMLLKRRRRALLEGDRRTANLCAALVLPIVQSAASQVFQDTFFFPRSFWLFGMIALVVATEPFGSPESTVREGESSVAPAAPACPS